MKKYEKPIAQVVSFDTVDVIAFSWETLITWGGLVSDVDGSENPQNNDVIWE